SERGTLDTSKYFLLWVKISEDLKNPEVLQVPTQLLESLAHRDLQSLTSSDLGPNGYFRPSLRGTARARKKLEEAMKALELGWRME
ncbi:hypothetical protein A6R68_13750, partial [Neotoma lepida]